MKDHRVLILTVSHGASHRRVGNALRTALLELHPRLRIELIDALQYCAQWFRTYYNSYELPLKYWPSLWRLIEGIQYKSSVTGPGWLYQWGGRKLFCFIQTFHPDIVIATEVGMCELASMLKRKAGLRYALVGAAAGVDVDRAWAQPEVDLYPIHPGELAAELEAAGVKRSKILPCGTPIDPAFSSEEDRETVRTRLAFQPGLPMVLVLFGGTGFGNPRRIVAELKKIGHPLQIVFITGKNQGLQSECQRLCRKDSRCRVLGWVDNMHEWMRASDLAVSKPGGLTVVEAMNCGLPLLAFDPLPGAERRACDLIECWQVGHWVRRAEELAPAIARLLARPEELGQMRKHALARARPHAAREAAEAIVKLLERSSPASLNSSRL